MSYSLNKALKLLEKKFQQPENEDAASALRLKLLEKQPVIKKPYMFIDSSFRNLQIDECRKSAHMRNLPDEMVENLPDEFNVLERLLRLESSQMACRFLSLVHEVLPELDATSASFFRRHHFHGESCNTISNDIGLNPNTGRSILFRARATVIRKALLRSKITDPSVFEYFSNELPKRI